MALSSPTTVPVSGINLGLAAGVTALGAEVSFLGEDLSGIGVAAAAQVTFTTSLPPNPAILLQFAAAANIATLTNQLNPLNWITLGATANLDLTAQLGIINGLIAIVAPVAAAMEAGLSTGGLYAWSYAGTARRFGTTLATATQYGIGGSGPTGTVNAVIVAATEHSTWATFGAGCYVGTSDDEDLGTATTLSVLTSLGELNGFNLNTGVLSVYARIALLLEELQGLAAALQIQIDFTLGIGLPDPQAILDIEVSVSLADILVSADFAAQIDWVNTKINLIAALIAELQVQLTTTGLTVWTYSGTAQGLGSEFRSEVLNGIGTGDAGDPTYGLVIAASSPVAWSAFGNIFYTG